MEKETQNDYTFFSQENQMIEQKEEILTLVCEHFSRLSFDDRWWVISMLENHTNSELNSEIKKVEDKLKSLKSMVKT